MPCTMQYALLIPTYERAQAFSTLAIEAILHARTLGISAVFTDHSLCGFSDVSSILVNKVLEFALADISHVICVSHTTYAGIC